MERTGAVVQATPRMDPENVMLSARGPVTRDGPLRGCTYMERPQEALMRRKDRDLGRHRQGAGSRGGGPGPSEK